MVFNKLDKLQEKENKVEKIEKINEIKSTNIKESTLKDIKLVSAKSDLNDIKNFNKKE